MEEKFLGFYTPTTTPVPDNFFDDLLADLSGNEVKVVCYIMRCTFGFKKESDNISLNQMLNGIKKRDGTQLDRGVGLSKPTLIKSLKSLAEKSVIVPELRSDPIKGNLPTNYRLKLIETHPSKRNLPGVVKKFNKPLVKKLYPQETVIQETVINTVNVNGSEKVVECSTATPEDASPPADKTDLRKLADLNQPREKTQDMADMILAALGDEHSKQFYYLVAAKVPESVIWKALGEIKSDGARNPAAVSVTRMKEFATQKLRKGESGDVQAKMAALSDQLSIQRDL